MASQTTFRARAGGDTLLVGVAYLQGSQQTPKPLIIVSSAATTFGRVWTPKSSPLSFDSTRPKDRLSCLGEADNARLLASRHLPSSASPSALGQKTPQLSLEEAKYLRRSFR